MSDIQNNDECKMKRVANYDFGFDDNTPEGYMNPIDAICYNDLLPSATPARDFQSFFLSSVGKEAEVVEIVAALMFFSCYAELRNTDVLVDIKYLDEQEGCDDTVWHEKHDINLLGVVNECDMAAFKEKGKEVRIDVGRIDSFSVKNVELSREFIRFFKENYHYMFTVMGFTDLLAGLMDGVVKKNVKIEIETNKRIMRGLFFVILDGEFYFRKISEAWKDKGGTCGGGAGPIEKVSLGDVIKIGLVK